MQIAIIGAGNVGTALARGWRHAGHAITFGARAADPAKNAKLAQDTGCEVLANRDAAARADVIVLSVPWAAVQAAVASLGDVTGKTIIDATNPLVAGPGGLGLALGFSDSGAETVQRLAKGASVFKTMNQVGFGVMDSAAGYPARPVMFVAGDDETRKPTVLGLVRDLGFNALDCGGLAMARLLEPYAMVWINQVVAKGASGLSAFAFLEPFARSNDA